MNATIRAELTEDEILEIELDEMDFRFNMEADRLDAMNSAAELDRVLYEAEVDRMDFSIYGTELDRMDSSR